MFLSSIIIFYCGFSVNAIVHTRRVSFKIICVSSWSFYFILCFVSSCVFVWILSMDASNRNVNMFASSSRQPARQPPQSNQLQAPSTGIAPPPTASNNLIKALPQIFQPTQTQAIMQSIGMYFDFCTRFIVHLSRTRTAFHHKHFCVFSSSFIIEIWICSNRTAAYSVVARLTCYSSTAQTTWSIAIRFACQFVQNSPSGSSFTALQHNASDTCSGFSHI